METPSASMPSSSGPQYPEAVLDVDMVETEEVVFDEVKVTDGGQTSRGDVVCGGGGLMAWVMNGGGGGAGGELAPSVMDESCYAGSLGALGPGGLGACDCSWDAHKCCHAAGLGACDCSWDALKCCC